MARWFRSCYAFEGDRYAGQLSFPPGAIICVNDARLANQNGWAHGSYHHESTGRWFPISYVAEIQEPLFPLNSTLNPFESTSMICVDKDDGGFGGPILGGTSALGTAVVGATAGFGKSVTASYNSSPMAGQDSAKNETKEVHLSGVGKSFRRTGQGISNVTSSASKGVCKVAQNTGKGIVRMTTKATKGVSSAAKESRYQLQDMWEQSHKPQEAPPNEENVVSLTTTTTTTTTTSPPEKHGWFGSRTKTTETVTVESKCGTTITVTETITKRGLFGYKTVTTSKTMTIPLKPKHDVGKNIANGAIKGAVLHGGVSMILGGNPVQAAKVGAVYGGAIGGMRGWEPIK